MIPTFILQNKRLRRKLVRKARKEYINNPRKMDPDLNKLLHSCYQELIR